jgi:hypothetical protein
VPLSDPFSRVEIITGVAHWRRFTTEQKLAVIADDATPACPSAALPVATASRQAWCFDGGG